MENDTPVKLAPSLSSRFLQGSSDDRITVSRVVDSEYIGGSYYSGTNCVQSLEISFHRTIRVADNGETNNLPPSLGRFPIYSTNDFAELPAAMANKGGFFVPMYQREAMWVGFRASQPFAIKIYVGGVNAVSGEPARETKATAERRLKMMRSGKNIQDYVVTPAQLWLDGIASEDGKVRQFVAVPLGSGYSVEAQITGEDVMGGLQIEVTPSKLPPTQVIEVAPKPPSGHCYLVYAKLLSGKVITLQASAEHTIDEIKCSIQKSEGIPPDEQRLINRGRQMEDHRTLRHYEMFAGAVIYVVLRLRGGGGISKHEYGIAAGGLIRQTILKDDHKPENWEPTCGTIFNVQILNSDVFKQVTGMDAPKTPITAKTYASYGYPYFDIYDEKPSGIKGDFEGVKSVNELDVSGPQTVEKAKAVAEVIQSTNNPVVLLDAEGKNIGFRPLKKMEDEVRERFDEMNT